VNRLNNGTRVGIVAHFSESNYGNHLVNLAAKRLLESCGCSVDLIVFTGGRLTRLWGRLTRLPLKLLRLIAEHTLADRIRGRALLARRHRPDPELSERDARRVARFKRFADTQLQPRFVQVRHRRKLRADYDLFFVGSDQIWNYDYGLGPWQFLDFASPSSRGCLAPSFGHESIPLEWKRSYSRWLRGFTEITVRESRWVSSLAPIVGARPVTQLPDPTLMLGEKDLAELAAAGTSRGGYILAYELGDFCDSRSQYLQEVSRDLGLPIRRLSAREPGEDWASDASDFLGMVRGAACVVTDSFHGALFAFLYNRPVVIVRREGFASAMNSRIDTIVADLHLEDRLIDALSPSRVGTHDYRRGYAALGEIQLQTWAYLSRHGLRPIEPVEVADS